MRNGNRIISLMLVMVMLFGMLPRWEIHAHAEEQHTHTESLANPADTNQKTQEKAEASEPDGGNATGNPFAGKVVSILSHSASTYSGVSNNAAANSTIGNNDVYYTEGRHGVYLKDTWWQQTIDALGMRLLVNNSWSGSCVFMPRKGESSVGYGDRAVNLHNDHTGEEPDIIFIYLGCNDFAYYKDTFGKAADVDYAAIIQDNNDGTFTYSDPETTCEAYAIMLHKVTNRYPNAEIYCMTSTARRDPDYADNYADTGQPTEYSAELHKVAAHFGFPVIDLENCISKEAEIFDQYMGDKRAHPNALGMDQITNEVLSVMLGRDAEICHVISEEGIVAEQAVLLGGSYHAEVELREGCAVVVTMNGEDVTAEVYNDGKISIEAVTGDIAVHTIIQRNPLTFRWEIQEDVLVSVGDTENALHILAGSVENGMLNNTIYQLTNSVVLKHDLPWEMEWRCAGDWRGVMFSTSPVPKTTGMLYISRTVGGQLSMGTWTGQQYDNYGVDLSYLDDQPHTYRFVNRIAADGSNMVWVYVDGEEIGPMNHYYIGSKDQGTASDWICGQDFVFSYSGMEGHALRNCKLDYLQVWEAGEPEKEEQTPPWQQITVLPGQLVGDTGEIIESDVYGYVVNYELKKGHILFISDTDYVFSVRRLVNGNYSQILKQANTSGFVATEDMTVAMLIRKPDKSAVTEEELASIVIYDYANKINYEETALVPLYWTIPLLPGQLIGDTGEIVENEIYGYVVNYQLRKGHTLSINDTDYVFSVRQLVDGHYATLLKSATTDSFTATEDMTVGMLIRKPDNTPLTEDELASIFIYDSQYGMVGVEGYAHRFTVEAETIDGGTASTRANIFLPRSYTEDGVPTKLIVMTNGYSAYLTDSVWNKNTADNINVIDAYLQAGYAVWVVDNTAASTSQTPDLGCPQLVSSYLKAYEYIQGHLNVEEKFSIHSRSFGTFAAMRIMQEVPELVKCGVMTGPRVSLELAYSYVDKTHVANRFGFEDATGTTYEADKLVGYNPYVDVDGDNYALPPTFWVLAEGDATEEPITVIEKLVGHGNNVISKIYADIDHTGICTLNQAEPLADALAYLQVWESGEPSVPEEPAAPDYSGKTISILGDSISTYTGVSNDASVNGTLTGGTVYYSAGTLGVYRADTWWQQVIDALGMKLLVNNSWSGSCVLHTRSNTVGAYIDRCVQLHNAAGETPDIIAVFLGTNDFSYYQDTLGTANAIDYQRLITDNGDGTYTYATPATTCEAYAIMLHKMTVRYPDAEIYCMTLTARRDPDYSDSYADVGQPTAFNTELTKIIEHFGCTVVDLEHCGIDAASDVFDRYMGDKRVHPNAQGMDMISKAVVSALLGKDTEIYDISWNLTGAALDKEIRTVAAGSAYTAAVTEMPGFSGLTVTVTMGGTDITADCYADGIISIPAVTGDIVISVSANREPLNFRWEFSNGALTGVTSGGNTENTLKKLAGTITDGVFSGVRYQLGVPVMLRHDLPWVLEWRCAGDWSGMLLTSHTQSGTAGMEFLFRTFNATGLLAFGTYSGSQYNNYGIPLAELGLDMTAAHTYRLENRVAADGTNMASLFIDGEAVGAMNNYFIGGTNDQDTTVDWLSGRDFVFNDIGSTSHPLNNMALEYLQIWEGGLDAPALEGFEYTLDEEAGTVILTKYTGTEPEVTVHGTYYVEGAAYDTVLDASSVFRGNTTITAVTISDGVSFLNGSMSYLFAECTKLVSVDLSQADTTGVTDMSYLFSCATSKASSLSTVDVTGLETGDVSTMRGMFSYCRKLSTLTGYEDWDTSALENMYHMFNYVQALETIDLRNWDLDQVKNTGWCFQLCYAKQILLPENLGVISAGFLNHATQVQGTTFTIPAGVKKIGYAHTIYDFATGDFVEFLVAEGNTHYKAVDGILYSADGTEMLAVPRGKTFENNTYEIPEGVTFLGELSFSRNYNIHTLVLPNSYVIEYVPVQDPAYVVFEDVGNLNAGTNLSIAIYCYTGITAYAVKADNPNYTSRDGIIYSKDMTQVVAVPARYDRLMDIPEGVTTWNMEAMWADYDNNATVDDLMANCPGVVIPASLTRIAEDQINKLNRLNRAFDSFTITVAEGNPVFCVNENGDLVTHSPAESIVTEPTCTEAGYTTHTCAICGDSYVDSYTEELGHSYRNGICTACGQRIEDSGLALAVPGSEGVANAIRRAYQLTDVTWTPLVNMPGLKNQDGTYYYNEFLAGVTYKGIPYSGVIDTDTYVGLNVSLTSFLTALENQNSVLYTENLFVDSYPKKATYFGTVCSKFAQYVLNVPGSYNTYNIPNIPGMDTVAMPGEYDANRMKLGDVIVDTSYHTAVCTGILYGADGEVAYIEISEAVVPTVRRMWWSVEEFFAHFADYRLCRYQQIDSVPAVEDAGSVQTKYALMPRFGDKYNYRVSASKGIVDILETGYTKAVILRDGAVIDEIAIDDTTETVSFDRSVPGYIEIYLEKADGTRSGSVYACVVQSAVSVTDSTAFASGKLMVTFDGSSGTPLYVQVGSAHAIFCNVEGQQGTAELYFNFASVSTQQVRVAYQNEYGIYLSPWTSFTAASNPSTDPLLSQGQYWDGYTLTPNSDTPVVQENKVGYWTYTMVPVEPKTSYYSEGANRMWFLDENGDPISTYNAYTESEVPFQFTTPEGTAYVSITYSPNLVEKGTETLTEVHEHQYVSVVTPPTCTEQGYTTHTCAICGDSYTTDYVDASGQHRYDDGVCVWCGVSKLGDEWIAPDFAQGDYSMVVLPDTQNLITYWPEIYYNQMQWIVDNQDALNIQAVLHMGDMVNNNNATEWAVSKQGMDLLNGTGIAWMPMRGNHDDSAWFNQYFDYAAYGTDQSWFGGSYHGDKLDHTYWFVTVGGREYMILSLGWAPSWDVLEWAKGVVEEHDDKSVILTCHAYMNKDGTLLSKGDAHCVSSYHAGYPDGDDVWAAFKDYGNVVLAMGGHIHSPDVVTWVDQNGAGENVTSLLFDRQDDDTASRLGMIALLTFHADSNTVDINWYSTRYDALYREKNQFSIMVPDVCEHSYTSEYVNPTCTEGGGTKHTCTICNHSYWENQEPALGHSYENNVCTICWIVRIDMTQQFADWTEGGPVLFRNGIGYGEKGYPDGPNPNLKYSDYISVEGIDTLELTVCARMGHSPTGGYAFYTDKGVEYFLSEGASTRNGNGAAAEGTVVHTITVPEGAKYIRVSYWVDSTSYAAAVPFSCVGYAEHLHTYNPAVTDPTCTEQGYTTHTCEICGDSYVDTYTDALGHSYVGTACETCGQVHPNAAGYEGKVISILSASTSTFAGYIPVADGFNLTHRARYPQDNLLTDVNETWWMQLIDQLGAKLGINESWAGSQVLNNQDTNSGDLGPDAAMASLTRIQNLGSNGSPDVILFFGGGNDTGRGVPLGSFDPSTAPAEVDLVASKWDTFADAYVAAIMRLQHYYPDAEIVVMLYYEMPSYVTAAKLEEYGSVIKEICDHYGVPYVELQDCGITFDMLPDGIHPNAEGMDFITDAVMNKLLSDIQVEAGENAVYTVTHDLTNAAASLGYYKGVSAGKGFAETLTGEDMTVSVTMGGVDVTDAVYAEGRISIPSVTGDIVITAKGAFNADGHLQRLPEDLCAGTNLWTALEPENIYYTASGWGNTSAGTSWSITFPVKAGDRIWATSLGAYPDNGSSANGVRVTWFDENGVLLTVSRDVVYAEFAEYGYITAPEGAVALNLPMTNNEDGYAVYILSAGHSYDSVVTEPTCTEGGYTTHTCETCGDSYADAKTEALGHSYDQWYVVAEATLRAPGAERRDCSRCDHYESREIPQKENPFSDVPEDQYYCDPVLWAVEKGITTGTGDGTTFSPDRACTRAQVVTFLWRAAGCPEPQNMTHNFTDVVAGSYYEKAVIWAVEQGITGGTGNGTTFSPDRICTRAEIVTFLWRAVGKPAPEVMENPFPDVEAGSYYDQAVLWAVENSITTGKGNGNFSPGEICTRGQVVTFLYRALEKA